MSRQVAIREMGTALSQILDGFDSYRLAHEQLYKSDLETDYFIGDAWERICSGLHDLLSGEIGELDGGKASTRIGLILERFKPQQFDDRTEQNIADYLSVKGLEHVLADRQPEPAQPNLFAAYEPPTKPATPSVLPPNDIGKKRLTNRQIELLQSVVCVDNVANFTGPLIDDWKALKTVMVALGSKWKTRVGFVFPDDLDGAETLRIAKESGEILDPREADFFETPRALADLLVDRAEIDDNGFRNVLEPSAGQGNIADAVFRKTMDVGVTMIEALPANVKVLGDKGWSSRVTQGDFLSFEPGSITNILGETDFDYCLMNPPFSKRADIHHVLHAFKFLKPGGVLVAIMSSSALTRTDKLGKMFKSFLEMHNADTWENEPGSFKESGTMVNTVMVRVRKPEL